MELLTYLFYFVIPSCLWFVFCFTSFESLGLISFSSSLFLSCFLFPWLNLSVFVCICSPSLHFPFVRLPVYTPCYTGLTSMVIIKGALYLTPFLPSESVFGCLFLITWQDHVHNVALFFLIELYPAIVDDMVNCGYRHWFLEVFLSPLQNHACS